MTVSQRDVEIDGGTELVEVETGTTVIVREVAGETLTVYGPGGKMELSREALHEDIKQGLVEVRS